MKHFLYVAALVFSGYATAQEIVSFSPAVGEQRSYQIYTQSQIKMDRGYQQARQSSLSLSKYVVTQADDVIRLDLLSDFFALNDGQLEGISSVDKKTANPQLHQLMADGFTLAVNADSGKLIEFKAKNEQGWLALLKRGGVELAEQMRDMLQAPAVMVDIPVQIGAVVELPEFKGRSATLTVTQVTDDTLLAVIDSNFSDKELHADKKPQGSRFFGNVLLDRNTGWLISMGLVVEVKQQSATARTLISMLPTAKKVGDLANAQAFYGHTFPVSANTDASINLSKLNRPVTQAQIFANPQGYFSNSRSGVQLDYVHGITADIRAGQTRLTDLHAYDESGNLLDLTLWHFAGGGSFFNDGKYRSQAEFLSLGWRESIRQLDKIHELRAQAEYTPAEMQKVTLALSADSVQKFSEDGVSIELSPVAGEKGRYQLRTTSVEHAWVTPFFESERDAIAVFTAPDISTGITADGTAKPVPDWLTDVERYILSLSQGEQFISQMLIHFEQPPQKLTFYINRLDESQRVSAPLQFITKSAYSANSNVAPSHEAFLFYDDTFHRVEQDQVEPISYQELKPKVINEYGLGISLPADWAQSCQLSVTSAPVINQHPLVWHAKPAASSDRFIPKQIDYVLATDDGIRRYFYNIEVTSAMQCSGTPHWNILAYTFGDKPWLVDISAADEGLDLTMSVTEFLSRYRLLNQQGKPLALAEPLSGTVLKLGQQRLQDVLLDQRWLRVAGSPLTIEKLSFTGEPVQHSWVTQFKPLPTGE